MSWNYVIGFAFTFLLIVLTATVYGSTMVRLISESFTIFKEGNFSIIKFYNLIIKY